MLAAAVALLLFGRDGNDPLFLQAKEAQPSVLAPYAGETGYECQGANPSGECSFHFSPIETVASKALAVMYATAILGAFYACAIGLRRSLWSVLVRIERVSGYLRGTSSTASRH